MDKAEQPTIAQADIQLADAVAEAIASVQIAYSHNTNAEFRTVDRKWSVHDACEGNPFEKDEWLAVFTDKEEAHAFARKLRQERAAKAVTRHRTTSLAAQDDVTLVEELRAEISNLEAALTQIAGSHWERYGIGQTDIEDVPDLSAEEAMNVARDALSNTPAPSLAAQDGLVAEIERQEGLVKTYRGAQLRAEEKLCREQANAQGWKRRAEMLESKLSALSAIKEQHHD